MRAYNKKKRPKHSVKIRQPRYFLNFKKIKLVYPKDESMVYKKVEKSQINFKFMFGSSVRRQVVFEIKEGINLSCVSGAMLGFLGSKNYWEVALMKNGSVIASTVTPGLTADVVEKLIKELKESDSLKMMIELMGGECNV